MGRELELKEWFWGEFELKEWFGVSIGIEGVVLGREIELQEWFGA